jgi:hypothetical protein
MVTQSTKPKGLVRSKSVSGIPDDIFVVGRGSPYDDYISAAIEGPIELTFDSEKRAANAYISIKERVKRRKLSLGVAKRRDRVYIGSPDKIRHR